MPDAAETADMVIVGGGSAGAVLAACGARLLDRVWAGWWAEIIAE
ncbi:MAG TPA: hypothetical protein VGI74_06570 [Streptosporangiaceae bacterium]|jgi:hypothetical protein